MTERRDNDDMGKSFLEYLAELRELGDVGSDDIVGLMAPLLEQVIATHEQNLLAPLNGIDALRVSLGHLWYANADAREPASNLRAIRQHKTSQRRDGFEITREISVEDNASRTLVDQRVAERGSEPRKAYFPDYIAWEQCFEHHDALTDTFVLGLVMGSVMTGLDLTEPDELAQFVAARDNLCLLNARVSPVIGQLIERMTELERSRRPQDLTTVAEVLIQYRYQELDEDIDFELPTDGQQSRRAVLLARLRNRLFEVSRRNRLLYFRETGGTANLTEASVPHVLDVESIRMQQLLFTNSELCQLLQSDKPIRLSRWLRFEDYPFLAPSLDQIRLQAKRDEREYGFSQLRLVTAFLRWHNLKDAPQERIHSPLILVPAAIVKKKGVRDHFELSVAVEDAEINPALRHYLNELYGLRLPEKIDAGNFGAIEALADALQQQLARSDSSVDLELVKTPRIQLIKSRVTRRLDRYRRRIRATGRGLKSYSGISYSYTGQRFEPLGPQIFARDIRPANAPNREYVEDEGKPRVIERMVAAASTSIERDFFSLDKGDKKGPRQWQVDLCAVTLANFSYRKMTLVRDYTELLNAETAEAVNFERLFSEATRPLFGPLALPPLAERYNVLPADPSQRDAVLRARDQDSYVIQGPPGTGKSQTITNLIVDYVARGKSVLFVCEKRVALDVVYHRLQQVGLEDACCLIHDVREDKKPFIMALKQRYEQAVAAAPSDNLDERRQDWLKALNAQIKALETFSAAMVEHDADGTVPLRQVIGRWIEGGAQRSSLDRRASLALPDWERFATVRERTAPLRDVLGRNGYDGILARSPVRYLRADISERSDYISFIEEAANRSLANLADAQPALDVIEQTVGRQDLEWAELKSVADFSRQLAALAEADRLDVLDVDSPGTARLQKLFTKLESKEDLLSEATVRATGWDLIETVDNVAELTAVAKAKEGSLFAVFSSAWRQAKRLVRDNYSGSTPSVYTALTLLTARQQAQAAVHGVCDKIAGELDLEELDPVRRLLTAVWHSGADLPMLHRDIIRYASEAPDAAKTLLKIVRLGGSLRRANDEISNLLCDYDESTALVLSDTLQRLANKADQCDEYADELRVLGELDPVAARALRRVDLPFDALELAVLDETIHRRLRRTRGMVRFDAAKLRGMIDKLSELASQGRELNSELALDVCARVLHEHLVRANSPMTKTTQEEKDWRRAYTRGRKLLEREFEKTRAYRSVRELFAADSGPVLRDLRPVWLMSPLSVADALPLNEKLFDVVIFDEASQIPLEDAIPTVSRSQQMIVVGDEMQLPPTAFFAGKASHDDSDAVDTPDVVQFDLNADSFLNRAGAALPSTLLNWHYRSRHESLIGFCNRAFYSGELKTIPTPGTIIRREKTIINDLDNVSIEPSHVFGQPITFHKLNDSPYSAQRNAGEATYIAHLVRMVLTDERDLTVGIVAFSQAQQLEIEGALARFAAKDKDFGNTLEQEESREEDGQYVGLFVKNLENVQGDERDIIILSVCYGPDPDGRMRMNFGPINQNGGHKRLNVIFSRAKQHMVVVSSIDPSQITNTYNEGANALRQYLRYAQAVSIGDREGMQAALVDYGQPRHGIDTSTSARALQTQIKAAIEARGYDVEENYGQSDLRCHLAVRRQEQESYELAVLIDDGTHYANPDIFSRYTTDTGILRAFGWRVTTVLGKDWYADKEKVIEQIMDALSTDRE
ncbi:MAG: AAA domain-containing protein [Pseudomonadota bacterium]